MRLRSDRRLWIKCSRMVVCMEDGGLEKGEWKREKTCLVRVGGCHRGKKPSTPP